MNGLNDEHLSQLASRWSLISEAIKGESASRAAVELILPRYCNAVYCYVRAILRDHVAVDDVAQEFAFRFIRGDFRNACPERGRFRDYIKIAVLHLVSEFRKRKTNDKLYSFDSRFMQQLADQGTEPEKTFVAEWRQDLINGAWARLRAINSEEPSLYTVLKRKTDRPEFSSAELASQLSLECGKPITAANVRQMLHRGRERFAELLREEVRSTLTEPTREELEQELADLGLLVYCNL